MMHATDNKLSNTVDFWLQIRNFGQNKLKPQVISTKSALHATFQGIKYLKRE